LRNTTAVVLFNLFFKFNFIIDCANIDKIQYNFSMGVVYCIEQENTS
jgi:hypothetical protein